MALIYKPDGDDSYAFIHLFIHSFILFIHSLKRCSGNRLEKVKYEKELKGMCVEIMMSG
jgi:hypothetical protein